MVLWQRAACALWDSWNIFAAPNRALPCTLQPPLTAPVVTVVCPMCLILYMPGICRGRKTVAG